MRTETWWYVISIYFHPLKRLENPSDLPTIHLEMGRQMSSSCRNTHPVLWSKPREGWPVSMQADSACSLPQWLRGGLKKHSISLYLISWKNALCTGDVDQNWTPHQLAGFQKLKGSVRLHNWQNKTDADSWISWLWSREVMIYSVHASHFSLDFSRILKL